MTSYRVQLERTALLVVDVQPDFMPGGALPVPQGDAVIQPINTMLARFRHSVATQDWHPADHSSFAGTWPPHCVQGTRGAELAPGLHGHAMRAVVRKGWRRTVDSYSGFVENDGYTSTGLAGLLHSAEIRNVVVCGLARDYCVGYTALDAARLGFGVAVVESATRSIAASSDASMTQSLLQAGVELVDSPADLHYYD